MQRSESRLRNRLSVTCGLALVWSFILAFGSAGAEVVVQSCAALVEPQDADVISSPAEVPGVYLVCASGKLRQNPRRPGTAEQHRRHHLYIHSG